MTDIVTKTSLSESRFNDLFWELELVMLENNVAMEVIERIRSDLKAKLVDQKFDRGRTSDIIMHSLQETIGRVLDFERLDIIDMVKEKEEKPFIIAFFGVNGAGKTTNLVKIAKLLESNGLSCVIAACDTFRAAAIQQLEEHAVNVGVKVIKHDYGADAAAVAFDTIKHAKAKGKDVVLIDTAGRQHSNTNLMDELKKLVRVSRPDLRVFVGESITGNDCIEQAQFFNDAAGIDAIILTKADVDEKGGAAISISYVINKPIIFFGTGQGYEDLKEFDKDFVMKNLGLA
ncbi:signal recognition particle-docking protein FtsY [Candidatus Woesearchaeota archaeon]|nr:signal recognition particle-docking protein FtsY [Candidatus Woesearchaeota archaeon]